MTDRRMDDRRTDRQTVGHRATAKTRLRIASRGKNGVSTLPTGWVELSTAPTLHSTHKYGDRCLKYNNNNNTNICKAHIVSIRADSEAPALQHKGIKIWTLLPSSYRVTLCVSAVFAVAQCPSVRHVGRLYPHGWRYRQTSFSAR